jgi:hypothetical protein
MKKNDLILISSVLIYSYLFFEQTAGINFLLFNIVLICLLLVKDLSLLVNTSWMVAASGSMICALCILYHNSTLAIIANLVSLSLMASLTINKGSSLILAALYSCYTFLSVLPFIGIDLVERIKTKASENNRFSIRLLIIGIPLLISLLFFFMYREANPLFKDFTKNISFDFISWEWALFTLGGFALLYPFFYHRGIANLYRKDMMASNTLLKEETSSTNFLLKILDVAGENLSGIVLLGLLNFLVLIVNILDINYIWISNELPEGITFSEFVHQGIGMLIASIITAILIILYYFRGSQNFFKKNLTLKVLAYIWIVQNVILILSTAVRNQLYINEFSLTYKRIGVYVYLVLCLAGLATTLVKIARTRSNWFLFRKNGWAFYSVLIISCLFNWDLIITRFNINYSKNVDTYYLFNLSPSSLPDLLKLQNSSRDHVLNQNLLNQRIYEFESRWAESKWQSWNIENQRIKKELEELQQDKKLGFRNQY